MNFKQTSVDFTFSGNLVAYLFLRFVKNSQLIKNNVLLIMWFKKTILYYNFYAQIYFYNAEYFR